MAIASSTIIFSLTQADGRIRTIERHITDAGTIRDIFYDAAESDDRNAIMAARASVIWQQILNEECESFIRFDIAPVFVNATKAILIAYIRQAYRDGNDGRLVAVARWLLNRISDGTVTDAQVQSAFGLTSGQYATLKTQMQSLVSSDDTINAAVGQ